eukprot:scaffold262073_cov14-Tisochrysis_lutea.AAC.1
MFQISGPYDSGWACFKEKSRRRIMLPHQAEEHAVVLARVKPINAWLQSLQSDASQLYTSAWSHKKYQEHRPAVDGTQQFNVTPQQQKAREM